MKKPKYNDIYACMFELLIGYVYVPVLHGYEGSHSFYCIHVLYLYLESNEGYMYTYTLIVVKTKPHMYMYID